MITIIYPVKWVGREREREREKETCCKRSAEHEFYFPRSLFSLVEVKKICNKWKKPTWTVRKRPQCIPCILWINKRIHLLAYLRQIYLCFTTASTRTLIMEPMCHPECLAEDDSGASQRCRISHITERENCRFSPSTSVRNIWWSEFPYTNALLDLTAVKVTSKHNTHKLDRLEMRVDRRVVNSATNSKHWLQW